MNPIRTPKIVREYERSLYEMLDESRREHGYQTLENNPRYVIYAWSFYVLATLCNILRGRW